MDVRARLRLSDAVTDGLHFSMPIHGLIAVVHHYHCGISHLKHIMVDQQAQQLNSIDVLLTIE